MLCSVTITHCVPRGCCCSAAGSSGATIRLYIEQYTDDAARLKEDAQVALKEIIGEALKLSDLQKYTGRDKPTVIT